MGFGEIIPGGAEEASLGHLPQDAPFSTISVEGTLSHSQVSINEFLTNCAKACKSLKGKEWGGEDGRHSPRLATSSKAGL